MGKRTSKKQFMKRVLLLAFVQVTIFTLWQMAVFTFTDKGEASTLIQWFYTLWGVEVGLLMLKKILEGWSPKSKKQDETETATEEVNAE